MITFADFRLLERRNCADFVEKAPVASDELAAEQQHQQTSSATLTGSQVAAIFEYHHLANEVRVTTTPVGGKAPNTTFIRLTVDGPMTVDDMLLMSVR